MTEGTERRKARARGERYVGTGIQCIRCGQVKPFKEFYWSSTQGTFSSACRECENKRLSEAHKAKTAARRAARAAAEASKNAEIDAAVQSIAKEVAEEVARHDAWLANQAKVEQTAVEVAPQVAQTIEICAADPFMALLTDLREVCAKHNQKVKNLLYIGDVAHLEVELKQG